MTAFQALLAARAEGKSAREPRLFDIRARRRHCAHVCFPAPRALAGFERLNPCLLQSGLALLRRHPLIGPKVKQGLRELSVIGKQGLPPVSSPAACLDQARRRRAITPISPRPASSSAYTCGSGIGWVMTETWPNADAPI